MKRTIKVDGMMCEHCAMHVKKALEALDEVQEATVRLKDNEVDLVLLKEVSDDVLAKAIEDAGYCFVK